MLEENKKIYKQMADQFIPGWRDMDKNELIIKAAYAEDGVMRDAYISAVMLKYWNKLDTYYYKCKLVITPEEVHSWLEIAILYAIKHKPWENPEMSIYGDANGPDKVMNRIIESKRLTFYQQLNRDKRKINSAITSLDSLVDEYKDIFVPSYEDNQNFIYHIYVKEFFDKKDYFMSFMIDALLYEDITLNGEINQRKLSSYMKNFDEVQCRIFSNRYDIPYDDVVYATQFIKNLSSFNMKNKIEYNIIRLRKLLSGGNE